MFLFVPGVISQQTDADCGEDVHTGNRMLRLRGKEWTDLGPKLCAIVQSIL